MTVMISQHTCTLENPNVWYPDALHNSSICVFLKGKQLIIIYCRIRAFGTKRKFQPLTQPRNNSFRPESKSSVYLLGFAKKIIKYAEPSRKQRLKMCPCAFFQLLLQRSSMCMRAFHYCKCNSLTHRGCIHGTSRSENIKLFWILDYCARFISLF